MKHFYYLVVYFYYILFCFCWLVGNHLIRGCLLSVRYVKDSYCRVVCIIVTEHQCPWISDFPWSAIVFSESEQFVPAWKETVFSNVCSSPRVQLADKFKIGYTTIIERKTCRMITFSMSSNSFGHGLIGSKTFKSWNPVKSGWLGEKLC